MMHSKMKAADSYLLDMPDAFYELSATELLPCYQSSICAVFDDFADTIGDGRNGINRLFGGRSHGVSCVS